MPKIKLPDFTGVEEPGEFNDPPKGLYVFKIREASEGETGSGGKVPGQPMGVVVLEAIRVVGGSKIKKNEFSGIWHRFPLDDANPGWTPRLLEFVNAVPKAVKKGTLDLDLTEGMLLIGKVKDGKSEDGDRRGEIAKLMPYTEENAGGAVDDDDDDDETEDPWTEEDLKELSNEELREAAAELDVKVPAKLTAKSKNKVISDILEAQEEEEEEEEETDGEGDDEDWDEESLNDLPKDELAEVAGEFEVTFPKRLTDAGRKRVVDAILEAQNGDDDDDDEDEDGDEEEGYEESDLKDMTVADLKTIATDEFELEIPKGKPALVKKKLIVAILEAQEEDDEDEDGEEEENEEDDGYDDMSKTELAKEARSRGIKVRQGMSQEKIVAALRENDGESDDDDDDDGDEEMDPDSMSLEEVKAALGERGISTKGSIKVLRAKLTKSLEADDGDPF